MAQILRSKNEMSQPHFVQVEEGDTVAYQNVPFEATLPQHAHPGRYSRDIGGDDLGYVLGSTPPPSRGD